MGSHRRLAPSGPDRGTGAARAAVTVLSAAAAALGALPAAAPAAAAPHGGTRAEVDRLYHEAEKATEDYDRADERADALRRLVHDAQDRIARRQQRVNTLRESIGSVAGAQYRSGGIDPSLALLFSRDPAEYLDRASTLDRISAHQAGELQALRQALRSLAQQRAEATGALAELEKSRTAVAAHKHTVERKLAQARRLLNSLSRAERAAYTRTSRSGRDDLLSGPDAGPAASGRAAAALAAARSALGRPYVWGANGPSGFDCSGLMQWAYAQAGVHLPRTSQEQRYAGRQIPLSQARPGDLVVYRSDASHVAMYVGGGRVIHAPHPGAPVRYDPVNMLPISSVTRV
ncbi:NlpC/P60 family protein [Streptomyces sp. NPDC059631]|uniref:C40 family peptidase n=1 Tax=unclassified Streptomyces TaxID=2593676 RepID=UPI0036CC4D5D